MCSTTGKSIVQQERILRRPDVVWIRCVGSADVYEGHQRFPFGDEPVALRSGGAGALPLFAPIGFKSLNSSIRLRASARVNFSSSASRFFSCFIATP